MDNFTRSWWRRRWSDDDMQEMVLKSDAEHLVFSEHMHFLNAEVRLQETTKALETATDDAEANCVRWLFGAGFYPAANALAELHCHNRALRGLTPLVTVSGTPHG